MLTVSVVRKGAALLVFNSDIYCPLFSCLMACSCQATNGQNGLRACTTVTMACRPDRTQRYRHATAADQHSSYARRGRGSRHHGKLLASLAITECLGRTHQTRHHLGHDAERSFIRLVSVTDILLDQRCTSAAEHDAGAAESVETAVGTVQLSMRAAVGSCTPCLHI